MKDYTSLCVAGSHGKTTTTGMLAAMMDEIAPTGHLIGDGSGEIHPDSQYLAVEACEYRRALSGVSSGLRDHYQR